MVKNKNKLNCASCEKLIPGYLEASLSYGEMAEFLTHVKSCQRCREELTISYLLEEGLNRLESGAAFDLNAEVEKSISQNFREIKWRYIRATLAFTLCAVIISVAFYYIVIMILNS